MRTPMFTSSAVPADILAHNQVVALAWTLRDLIVTEIDFDEELVAVPVDETVH